LKLSEKVEDDVLDGMGGHVLVYGGEELRDSSKTLRDYKVSKGRVKGRVRVSIKVRVRV
jgi:hypothetical protein